MKHFCLNCGTEVKANAAFCPNCGFKLTPKVENTNNSEKNSTIKKVEEPKSKAPVEPKKEAVQKPVEKKTQSATKKAQIFCPNCGHPLKPGAEFCANCGYNLIKKVVSQNKSIAQPTQPTKEKIKPEKTVPSINDKKAEQPHKVQVFCPNCGHPLKPGAEFCSNCGYNLKTKQVPKSNPQPQVNTVPNLQPSVQHKPMKNSTKVLLSIVGVLIVALIGFYAWGSSYYSTNNQVDRITAKLPVPSQDLSPYVTADNASVKVTKDAVKPLQEYYKEHQTEVTKLNSSLKAGVGTSNISLVKNGHYWVLFPKYQLRVKTYQPQIVTNHANSVVKVNGKNVGNLSKSSDGYYKKMGLIFPGKYHVVVNSQVAGRKLSATSTANIFGNKTLDMDIATQTFSVKSVPNGVIYINDKKVGTLDSKGEATFKSYPITKNMELYVMYNNNGKSIKSEPVTDMASSFGAFDDDYSNDDDDYYSDEASDDSSDDVTKSDGGYVVEPKWKGVISTDEAKDLLNDAFENLDDSAFVDGSANKDYNDIKKMEDAWDNDDDIDDYDTDASVISIYPASNNSCSIVFRITYTFDNGDNTKKQVMEYHGGIIQKNGDDQKIKTIGNGKMISSKTYD